MPSDDVDKPRGPARDRRPAPMQAARDAAREAMEAAREAKEVATEARGILAELRSLTSSLIGRLGEASLGPEELAEEPRDAKQSSWMLTGPERLPSEMAPETLKSTLGWQFEKFWDLPHEQQLTLY